MSANIIANRIKTLRQQRAELKSQADAILAAAAERDFTDEERAQLDGLQAQLEKTGSDLERFERAAKSERGAVGNEREARVVAAFHGDPMCGFKSSADFALAVARACTPGAGQIDERLGRIMAAPTGYHETSGSSGEGYLVPPAIRQEIWDQVFSEADYDLLGQVDLEPTSSNAVGLLADETTPWGASGVTASWRSEGTQMTASKASVEPRTVKLHQLYAFVLATDELLSDGPRLRSRVTVKAGQAIRYKASLALMRGTGAGQPLGWFPGGAAIGAIVSVAKESGQAADTIVAANIAKMYARLLPGAAAGAVWLINPDAFPQLPLLTIGNVPIWTPPSAGFANAPGGLLFGRPVLPSEHCSTVGDLGDIQLVSPRQGYYAITKAGESIEGAESMHLFFDYGMTAFRWTFRLGGQPFLSAPVTPPNSTATKSHFVTLAARA